jgi:Anti-sigma-K factor rskA/Putative zinc-finger
MDHQEIQELLGAYALDAVEPDEAAVIESHLDTCPKCRDELRTHREVVGVLAYAGQEAPPGLWDRIRAEISEAGPHAETVEPGWPGPAGGRPGPQPPALRMVPAGSEQAWSAELRRSRRRTAVLTAVVAVAAALLILLGIQVARLQHRTDHLSGQVAALTSQPTMASVRAALAVPGSRQVALRASGGGGESLDAVILPGDEGYLYDPRLVPLSASETYQLWGVSGEKKISYGLIGSVPAQVTAFRAGPGVQALAVTAEVAGGVPSTNQAPIVAGNVG